MADQSHRVVGVPGCHAHWLAADPDRHARLEGTTADVGPMPEQVELSLQRADRVQAVLISLGAHPTQITTTGVGSDFPQFVRDRDADRSASPCHDQIEGRLGRASNRPMCE